MDKLCKSMKKAIIMHKNIHKNAIIFDNLKKCNKLSMKC